MASTAMLREIAKSVGLHASESRDCAYGYLIASLFCQHFEAHGRFPPRPKLPNAAQYRENNDAALTIQKQWIKFFFLRKDAEVQRYLQC